MLNITLSHEFHGWTINYRRISVIYDSNLQCQKKLFLFFVRVLSESVQVREGLSTDLLSMYMAT